MVVRVASGHSPLAPDGRHLHHLPDEAIGLAEGLGRLYDDGGHAHRGPPLSLRLWRAHHQPREPSLRAWGARLGSRRPQRINCAELMSAAGIGKPAARTARNSGRRAGLNYAASGRPPSARKGRPFTGPQFAGVWRSSSRCWRGVRIPRMLGLRRKVPSPREGGWVVMEAADSHMAPASRVAYGPLAWRNVPGNMFS
ncbi:hypothetical protein BG023_1170 [Porphyrobacter sp. LM 6]|nr:hypothetical protein BG023_1170 [Porphyrobacter sp. LM 6]